MNSPGPKCPELPLAEAPSLRRRRSGIASRAGSSLDELLQTSITDRLASKDALVEDASPEVPMVGCGRGRGRGRGSGRGNANRAAPAGSSTNSELPPGVSAKMAEAEVRMNWAQKLGKGTAMDKSNYGFDDKIKPDTPPSFGLWDLARQKRLRPEKWVASLSRHGIDNALHKFISRRLLEDERLWCGSADHERKLRCGCLCDQFCRQAKKKYSVLVSADSSANTWDAYLRTPRGCEHIEAWLQKKVCEYLEKRQPV